MKFKYILPLLIWIIPTIIISLLLFKYDAPLTDTQYVGFSALLISACITYITGVRIVQKDK